MRLTHCIQCTDKTSGKVGCFIHAGDFVAISPVHQDLIRLYEWMRANGWRCIGGSVADLTVEKVTP